MRRQPWHVHLLSRRIASSNESQHVLAETYRRRQRAPVSDSSDELFDLQGKAIDEIEGAGFGRDDAAHSGFAEINAKMLRFVHCPQNGPMLAVNVIPIWLRPISAQANIRRKTIEIQTHRAISFYPSHRVVSVVEAKRRPEPPGNQVKTMRSDILKNAAA